MSKKLNEELDNLNVCLFELFNLFKLDNKEWDSSAGIMQEIKDFLKEYVFVDNYQKEVKTSIYIKCVCYTIKEYTDYYKASNNNKGSMDYSMLLAQLHKRMSLIIYQIEEITPYYIDN